MRLSKVDYYLGICKSVAQRSSCSRRKFGAVLVSNDQIISTGYNGSSRGCYNCGIPEEMVCLKDIAGEKHLESYEYCPAIHAEQNCVISSDPQRRVGSTMFLASATDGGGDRPCHLCRRFILQGQIKDIYYLNKDGVITHEDVCDWIKLENLWMEVIRDKN
jgi:dCMP deaminase